ncbi:MAG: APC family permease, partial [Rhodospirillales bacterium]|nr:APC family permease [Rhodospirillales bacterium]
IGVREIGGLAAAIGALEILGLLAAIGAGLAQWGAGAAPAAMLPEGLAGWHGTLAGAFIAFFAFIGFETLANLAEETKDPARTLPRGILAAIAVSSLLYIAVAAAAVLGGTAAGGNPLLGLFEGRSALLFALVGFLAIANGVLVEIVMLSRLFYGMARREQLPAALAAVAPRTRTPVRATCLAGAIVLAAALLLPFERLIVLANALTLAVFAVVDLALWRVQRRGEAPPGTFDVPRWVPPLAAALALALLLSELL